MTKAVLKSTQETSANFGEQEKKVTHVSDQEHKKRHIQHIQREIQSLKEMKEQEKQEGISQGRKKWFNKHISSLRSKISDIEGESSE